VTLPQAPPPLQPDDSGLLDVGDGNLVYWETCGNPEGTPALVVHGGPGSGCSVGMRRAVDPSRHRLVLFDQRGCGRSRPHASDPSTDMSVNTTHHLIADMELLREHLGIDRWLLWGGSWGSTLALAYAEAYPQRVSGIVLVAVTTSRRYEIDWLYRGVGRFFPAAWREFLGGAECGSKDDVVAAYAKLMEHPDRTVRQRAALDWATWEDAVVGHEPGGKQDVYRNRPPDALLAFVRTGSWSRPGRTPNSS
jgi:proline iminopeptidase